MKYEELQNTVERITAANQQLENARNNFENQAKEYGILYKDEQAEKKQREERFLELQDTHINTRIKLERIINILIVFLLVILMTARLLSSLGIVEIKP